jgi:hypothetical protein
MIVFTKFTNTLQILQCWKLTVWKRSLQLHQPLRMGLRSIGLCELLVLFEQTKLLCIDFSTRYIHGGALWRPIITASSFALTNPQLPHVAQPAFQHSWFRISQLQTFNTASPTRLPQLQQFTQPDNPARNVKHPTHMNVVFTSLYCL